ncbi:MAG: exodeoxyribonuclease VII large subunit [Chloroflexota bacterium]
MISVLSVSEVTGYLKETLEADETFQDLWVQGEVSNFVQSQAGHLYFTLKDAGSQLRCVIFRGQLAGIAFKPQNGIAVLVHGRLSVYEVSGQVQLYADKVRAAGIGQLYLAFEALRRRLEAEGLFEAWRKRPLPRFPQRIGVVTSPTGAALRDIVKVIARRYPSVELVVAPTLVQGDGAATGIAAAIAGLNRLPAVDLIILARGGGSIEDLWPFNEEEVARAIFGSRVPVVTGVGHETDVTIADMVADVRAPTPSVAAELAVPDRGEYLAQVAAVRARADLAVGGTLEDLRLRLEDCRRALGRLVPPPRFLTWRQQIDDLNNRTGGATTHAMALWRERVRSRDLQLTALDPRGVLARGYSVCWHIASGKAIKNVAQARSGDAVQVQVADGMFFAEVQTSASEK